MTAVSGWFSRRTDVEIKDFLVVQKRNFGQIICCVTQVLLFGRLFPAASLTPSALLLLPSSFFKQVLCLWEQRKHPTGPAWSLGAEGEYRQTLGSIFNVLLVNADPDHPCRGPPWGGGGTKTNKQP